MLRKMQICCACLRETSRILTEPKKNKQARQRNCPACFCLCIGLPLEDVGLAGAFDIHKIRRGLLDFDARISQVFRLDILVL